jgi:site-specific recombinase XerD
MMEIHLLTTATEQFLCYLEQTRHSTHTVRSYGTTLAKFAAHAPAALADLSVTSVEQFLATQTHLSPATQARQQAALNSFFTWAVRHDLLLANPMIKIERVQLDDPAPRGLRREQIEAIFAVIPRQQMRDRLLFRLIYETGLRVGEALGVHIEDLDLTPDDEHLTVLGKGNRRRTVLLDDPKLVTLLRQYLQQTGYRHGALFRASKNGQGGAVSYQAVQERWARYGQQAGIACTLHQLRHSHATELVNGGVSLATIRKRLGHKRIQTTLRYAEQSDATADAELRAWRRQQART